MFRWNNLPDWLQVVRWIWTIRVLFQRSVVMLCYNLFWHWLQGTRHYHLSFCVIGHRVSLYLHPLLNPNPEDPNTVQAPNRSTCHHSVRQKKIPEKEREDLRQARSLQLRRKCSRSRRYPIPASRPPCRRGWARFCTCRTATSARTISTRRYFSIGRPNPRKSVAARDGYCSWRRSATATTTRKTRRRRAAAKSRSRVSNNRLTFAHTKLKPRSDVQDLTQSGLGCFVLTLLTKEIGVCQSS